MSTRYFVLAAIGVMMASLVVATTTMTLTPMNLKATIDEKDDDRDVSPALTMTKKSTNPSGSDEKEIKSSEQSERAAAVVEREADLSVRVRTTDAPALDLEGTVERGEESKTISRESAEQSSVAESNRVMTESITIAVEDLRRD